MRPKFDKKFRQELEQKKKFTVPIKFSQARPLTDILKQEVNAAYIQRLKIVDELKQNINHQLINFGQTFDKVQQKFNPISQTNIAHLQNELLKIPENEEKLIKRDRILINQCKKCYHLSDMITDEQSIHQNAIFNALKPSSDLTANWTSFKRKTINFKRKPFEEQTQLRVVRRYEPADMILGEFLEFLKE